MDDTPIVDFHVHVGHWGRHGMTDEPERFLRAMDATGVDVACINCIFFGDARRGNDLVASIVEGHPTRFVGAAFVTPYYPEEAIAELDRAFDQLGMKFLKIYPPYFGRSVDDPAYFPIYEWCNERGTAVMSHQIFPWDPPGTTIERRFAALSERFPNIRWVLAHAGAGGGRSRDAVAATKVSPNIYLETASGGSVHGGFAEVVNRAGADKVLFGSDMPLFDVRIDIAKIVTADISDDAKRKVLGLNAIELLGLEL
jgi:predicted TIM-barrel fold metal-dependent hydrolase